MQRARAISVQRFLILNRVIDEDRILIAATTIVDGIPIASKSIGAWNTRSRSRLYDRGSIKITKRERDRGGERDRWAAEWTLASLGDLIHQPECKFHSIKRILVFS